MLSIVKIVAQAVVAECCRPTTSVRDCYEYALMDWWLVGESWQRSNEGVPRTRTQFTGRVSFLLVYIPASVGLAIVPPVLPPWLGLSSADKTAERIFAWLLVFPYLWGKSPLKIKISRGDTVFDTDSGPQRGSFFQHVLLLDLITICHYIPVSLSVYIIDEEILECVVQFDLHYGLGTAIFVQWHGYYNKVHCYFFNILIYIYIFLFILLSNATKLHLWRMFVLAGVSNNCMIIFWSLIFSTDYGVQLLLKIYENQSFVLRMPQMQFKPTSKPKTTLTFRSG